jgi:branched-chain amino acid aminotransferase
MSDPNVGARLGDGVAFIDGEYLPIADARIPIVDCGFLHSDATYDVVHVWKGRFFRLDDHCERFERGVAILHMSLPHTRDQMKRILMTCVRMSGLREAYVEMICTRGIQPRGARDPRMCENRFYAFVIPFVWIANAEQRQRGLKLVIGTRPRIPRASVDPTVKNYHWLDFVMGLYEAYDRGGETVVLVDGDGNVTEGPGFNVFAVADGQLRTPEAGVLEGVTRRSVIELCAETGTPAAVDALPAEIVRTADEAFITSTAGGIMPVATVDGEALAHPAPGPVTRRIHDLYWSKKEAGWYGTTVEYE